MPAKCGTVDYRTKIYLVHAGLFISVKILCPVLVVHEYLESTETIGFSPRDLGLKMLHSFTRSYSTEGGSLQTALIAQSLI
jgi:hypothetical protein